MAAVPDIGGNRRRPIITKVLSNIPIALAAAWLSVSGVFAETAEVDLEIVLAVDASGSVNRNELKLQLDGIAAALRDQTVQRAITLGPNRKIAASMLIWSDAAFAKFPTEWHVLDSPASAEIFAKKVENFQDTMSGFAAIGGGGTGLGDGLAYALEMINNNGINAQRRIVDVSGDGVETHPWNKGAIMLPEARSLAMTSNATVNGLAITTDIQDLTQWYRQNVAVGPGSFVLTATNFQDFKRAIRKKLLREFSPPAIGLNNSKRRSLFAQRQH